MGRPLRIALADCFYTGMHWFGVLLVSEKGLKEMVERQGVKPDREKPPVHAPCATGLEI